MKRDVDDMMRRRTRLTPKGEALVDTATGERLNFAALDARIDRAAGALAAAGIAKGDRVALLCFNGAAFVEAFYGALRIGAVPTPLNWRLTPAELAFIVGDCGARAMVFGAEFADAVAALKASPEASTVGAWLEIAAPDGAASGEGLPWSRALDAADAPPATEIAPEDPATIVYTSGTTGRPKGAVHTHHSLSGAILNGIATFDCTSRDRYLLVLPLFHVGALAPMLMMLWRGMAVVVMRQFDPAAMWRRIEEERITQLLAVPAMLNFMLQAPNFGQTDYSTLRDVLSGASPVPVSLIRRYQELGIQISQVYGMTESCGPGCYLGGEEAMEKAGSTGRGYMLTDIRVVDAEGEDVAPGVPGEVLIRGEHLMQGYWNRPDATAETIRDGWLHTGDVAILDEDGCVTIHDRLKDMIISGGENVYPAEIEDALLGHPDVADVAVIGQPSERWGESPFAVIVPAREGVDPQAVLAACEGRLAHFKWPKGVALVEEIPRNPTGKALKRVLRDRFPGPAPG